MPNSPTPAPPPLASLTTPGLVGIEAQSFAGIKTFAATVNLDLAARIRWNGEDASGFYRSGISVIACDGSIIVGNTVGGGSGLPGRWRGQVADGASAIAHKFSNSAALSNASGRLAVFYSDAEITERAYFYTDGSLAVPGTAAKVFCDNLETFNSARLTVLGYPFDGASAVGVRIGSGTNLVNATAKAVQFVNNAGTEIAYLAPTGNLFVNAEGSTTSAPRIIGPTTLTAGTAFRVGDGLGFGFQTGSGQRLQINSWWGIELHGHRESGPPSFVAGAITDACVTVIASPTANALNDPTLVVKLATSQTGHPFEVHPVGSSTALFAVDVSGQAIAGGNGYFVNGVGAGLRSNAAGTVVMAGGGADGASAIGCKFGNDNALANAGARIAVFYSDLFSTEQVSIMADGTVKAPFFKSTTATPAAAGVVRLAAGDKISWRKADDTGDVSLQQSSNMVSVTSNLEVLASVQSAAGFQMSFNSGIAAASASPTVPAVIVLPLNVLDNDDAVFGVSTNGGTLLFDVNYGGATTFKGTSGITAFAGGGQASATQLLATVNFVTTVATTGDSVKLPVAALGKHIVVFNDGGNSLNIFPTSGGKIDALATDAAYALAAGASREFWGKTATDWKSR